MNVLHPQPRTHRPTYVLWIAGTPVAVCSCHWMRIVRWRGSLPAAAA